VETTNFGKLYDEFADAIFRHCYFRVYDRELAKDLTQETFIKTWDYLSQGRLIENMRAFLYQVANNLVIDNARKKKPISLDVLHDQGFDPSEDPSESFARNLEAKNIIALLRRLDAKYREVVVFRYVDDLGPREIAAILGESENVVSVRLNRALKQLRELISRSQNNGRRY
jgi:RNA polymerase sigma-70 factor (ECF subfamily)